MFFNFQETYLSVKFELSSGVHFLPGILDIKKDHGTFIFDHELDTTSPGQACVFYKNDQLLGGGWITS